MNTKYIANNIVVDLDNSECIDDNGETGDLRCELWVEKDTEVCWIETSGNPEVYETLEEARHALNLGLLGEDDENEPSRKDVLVLRSRTDARQWASEYDLDNDRTERLANWIWDVAQHPNCSYANHPLKTLTNDEFWAICDGESEE